jgi:hypothetical protein
MRSIRFILFSATALTLVASSAVAQGRGGPQVVSPEVHADRRVTFRITAPDAQKVEVRTPGDIPGSISPTGRGLQPFALTKNADGVWDATVGPGSRRRVLLHVRVNGVTVIDSRNPIMSQTNTTVWPRDRAGLDVFDTRAVSHGAVARCSGSRRRSAASAARTSIRRRAMRAVEKYPARTAARRR